MPALQDPRARPDRCAGPLRGRASGRAPGSCAQRADHLAARPHRPARNGADRRAGAASAERAARAGPLLRRRQLLGTVTDGPPYATEWVDENPFERREISVEVSDTLGHEAQRQGGARAVRDHRGGRSEQRAARSLGPGQDGALRQGHARRRSSRSLENDVPQKLDIVRQEAVGATFALMVDSSSSMSRRMDFVQRTAATLSRYLSPLDRMIVAPFSMGVGAVTGPTNDRPTILQGIEAIRPAGGTAILDSLVQVAHSLDERRGAPRDRADHRRLRRAEHGAGTTTR